MRFVIAFIFLLFFVPLSGVSEEYSAEIAVDGKPSTQWLVISDGQGIRKVVADRVHKADKVIVKADLSLVDEKTMGSFVVLTETGQIFSTPLTLLKFNELEKESIHLAEEQIPFLQEQLEQERARLEAKRGELNLVNLKKRREFGLDEVDRVYERIAILKEENQRILANSTNNSTP